MALSTLLVRPNVPTGNPTGSWTGSSAGSTTIRILGGQIYGGDYVKDIYKMSDDFNFSKIDQKLNERRSGHRSLVYENQVGFSS